MALIHLPFTAYILLGGSKMKGSLLFFTVALALTGCSSVTDVAMPVNDFELDRYLGSWYEIARIDFRYEKVMDDTTANYSKNTDGTVKVVNRGYDFVKNEWKEAVGKARFRGEDTIGALEVSFFGPFYSEYNILALDDGYKYALVGGRTYDNLWILSREKTIPEDVKEAYLELARAIGYDTDRLYWVNHE